MLGLFSRDVRDFLLAAVTFIMATNYAVMKHFWYCTLSFFLVVFPGKSQSVANYISSTSNDTIVINDGFIKYEIDSFYNYTLIRRRIYAEWGLMSEVNYNMDGSYGECFHSYNNAKKEWVRNLDYNTGHWIEGKWDEKGRIEYFQEMSTDSFDAEFESYYTNGNLAVKGYHRKTILKLIKSFTDTSFVLCDDQPYLFGVEAQVGMWNYYYSNGVDSAIGNYAYLSYQYDSLFPSLPSDLYIMIGSTLFPNIKTATWNYYSKEGKLIRREEWDEGNLLKRETF